MSIQKNLIVIHDLNSEQFSSSKKFLLENTDYQDIILKKFEGYKTINALNPSTDHLVCLHLDLNREVNIHHRISLLANENNICMLNPYDALSEIMDKKNLFISLMQANDIKVPKTIFIDQHRKFGTFEQLDRVIASLKYQPACIIIKPNAGTENYDIASFDLGNDNSQAILDHVNRIQSYDDVLVQQFIAFDMEYKILFLNNVIYSSERLNDRLIKLTLSIVHILKSKVNGSLDNRIFSLDLLIKNDLYYILEANTRPAGIFRQAKHSYDLNFALT